MTLPTPTVLLDDGTGSFPFDISAYVLSVDGYQVSRGRDDWQGAVTAGQLNLTLNNSDGRFTPGSTILATPSPITVDQRIRVIEGIGTGGFGLGGFGLGGFGLGGTASYARFTGYIKSWPVSWPATVTTFSEVQITATDAQARAERRTLRSLAQEEFLSAGAAAYHPLDEPSGSVSAGDLSGQQTPLLPVFQGLGTYAFGTDLSLPDGSTGLTFTQGPVATSPSAGSGYDFSRGGVVNYGSPTWTSSSLFLTAVFMQSGGTGGASTPFLFVNIASGSGTQGLTFNSSGKALWNGCVSPTSLMDGLPHVISVQAGSGLSTDLWVDGVKVSTAATLANTWDNSHVILAGQQDANLVTTWGHVAYGPRIADAKVSAIHQALRTMLAGETTTARLTRLGGYAGLTIGSLDTSSVTLAGQATTGVSAWSAIQDAADAALGLVYIDGSGALTFHDGARVPSKTAPDLTLSSQWVTPDVVPVVDDQRIVNYVEATSQGTGAISVAQSLTSQTTHGRYPESVTYLVPTDQQALDRANWDIANGAVPAPRFGTLTINLYAMTATQAQSVVAALDLDCWLRVTSLASQNPGGTVADVVVQGFQPNVTAEGWTITCNVVARSLFNAFIADDPVYGIADAAVARAFI